MAFSSRYALAAIAGLVMSGCSTIEIHSSAAPIEVIESNYMESTNDAEIVQVETSLQKLAAIKRADAS